MNRREYIAILAPAIGLGAGCSYFLPDQEERDLWSVSVNSIEIEPIDLDVEVERRTATTAHPATVLLSFRNPTDQTWELRQGKCLHRSSNEEYKRNLILWPASLEDDRHPEPVRRDCWKPDPESYNQPCEAVGISKKFSPGESWSIRHEVWIGSELDCIPVGTFEFEIWARNQDDKPVGTFSLTIESAEQTTSRSAMIQPATGGRRYHAGGSESGTVKRAWIGGASFGPSARR